MPKPINLMKYHLTVLMQSDDCTTVYSRRGTDDERALTDSEYTDKVIKLADGTRIEFFWADGWECLIYTDQEIEILEEDG